MSEKDIAAVLQYRYGDGLVYLPKDRPQDVLKVASQQGFIDSEGYLTRKGRALLARYSYGY
ncbi:MAG: hypothetical protein P8X93_02510 [Gammaproteobacteria bacterium]